MFSVPVVAEIIVAWVNARSSRMVTITLVDDTTWHAGSKSAAEIENLLSRAKSMLVLETAPADLPITDAPSSGPISRD